MDQNIHHHSSSEQMYNDEIDLKELLLDLFHHKFLILIVMTVCFLLALIYVLPIPPTYQTTALIQVNNNQSQQGLSSATGLDLSNFLGVSGSASASDVESALMQSEYILKPVILKNNLNIHVQPRYFPLIGKLFAKYYQGNQVAPAKLGLSQYAWGGEQLDVKTFAVPFNDQGSRFTLVAFGHDQYGLYDQNDQFVLKGTAGKLAFSDVIPGIKLFIQTLKANPGTQFFIAESPINLMLDNLTKVFSVSDVSSNSLQKSETGVLKLTLTGINKTKIPVVLNTIIHDEVQQNSLKKLIELRQTLAFLQQQLPSVKAQLDTAEKALIDYQAKTGPLVISDNGQTFLTQLTTLEQNLQQTKLQKTELLLSYTSKHPLIIALSEQEKQIQSLINQLMKKIQTLPQTEQEVINLQQNVSIQENLYSTILTTIQQMQITQAGTVGDVRVLDYASEPIQMPSKKLLVLLGSLIGGFILAVMIIFIRKMFTHQLEDPDYIEGQLGLSIYSIVPYSQTQQKIDREIKRRIAGAKEFILAKRNSKDPAVESLRSLRTTLQFDLIEAKNNIVAITGAVPNIGKSFLSLNLAFVLTQTEKTVLLIDADMRKGKIENYLTAHKTPGFTQILEGKVSFDTAKQTVHPYLDFIPTGGYPHNPAELLLKPQFNQFLTDVSACYDIVLIDTPPILPVTDGIIITQQAGVVLFAIGTAGEELKEIEHAIKQLKKNNVPVNGLILNNTKVPKQHHYHYYNYNNYYSYEDKKSKK